MTPGLYPLTLYHGDTYAWRFRCWEDEAKTIEADLTGVVAKAEIRERPGGTVLTELDCTVELPNIVMVRLGIYAWDGWSKSKAAWDLQLTWPSDDVVTIVAGPVVVESDITDSTPVTISMLQR